MINGTNMTTEIAPNISEDTTSTPAPEVNDTLIGRSIPQLQTPYKQMKVTTRLERQNPLEVLNEHGQ
jgi:hypothetical protein